MTSEGKLGIAKIGRGRIIAGDLETALRYAEIVREPMTDMPGLRFIRREIASGANFVVNQGQSPLHAWIPVGARRGRAAVLMDPLTGRVGAAAARKSSAGLLEIYMQLEPNASIILRTFAEKPAMFPTGPIGNPSGRLWNLAANGG